MISFIVSAYDRPKSLAVVLASIGTQTEPHEAIVCCNSPKDKPWWKENRKVAKQFGAAFYPTGQWGAFCGYSSAEMVIDRGHVKGDWLAFPCDDTIYFQAFSDIMMRKTREDNLDLVYCAMVNDPMTHPGVNGFGRYGVHQPKTHVLGLGKDQFMMRRSWFYGFPGKVFGGPNASDGLLIRSLIARGARHGKAPGILLCHQ